MCQTKKGVSIPITLLFNPQLWQSPSGRMWAVTDVMFKVLWIRLEWHLDPYKVICLQGESQSGTLGFSELEKETG